MLESVGSILQNLSFPDLIDILLVWFIIYRFLVIIQGTRAKQMLTGLFFLGVLFYIGRTFNFFTLNWLLGHLFENFLVLIVIVFQEQIRDALAQMAMGSFFNKKRGVKVQSSLQEVFNAIDILRKEKVGAIIVLEQKQGLENFIKSGTRLDAQITTELIVALFKKESPLHDGAIIIDHRQIRAAGCFLPLSQEKELHRQLGTRHRAALGLSEVSDAFVIVISEETGKVGLCYKRNLIPFGKGEDLPALILELKAQEEDHPWTTLFRKKKLES